MPASLQDVAEFVSTASSDDITRIYDFCKQRNAALRQIAAAAVSTGNTIELANIKPKYLDGLKGVVGAIKGARCDVTLDEESTTLLRYTGGRFEIPFDLKEYVLVGVPLSACKVVD